MAALPIAVRKHKPRAAIQLSSVLALLKRTDFIDATVAQYIQRKPNSPAYRVYGFLVEHALQPQIADRAAARNAARMVVREARHQGDRVQYLPMRSIDIARATGMTQNNVSRVLDELRAVGLLRKSGRGKGRVQLYVYPQPRRAS